MTGGEGPPPTGDEAGPAPLIADLIRKQGPVPFDVFMELALYGASGGYYVRGAGSIGREGDYYTAPDATPAFGWTLAEQIAECCERLGEKSYDVVEPGAGKGLMAADILDRLAEGHRGVYGRLTYWIVERSPAMREAQSAALRAHAERVRWAPGPEGIRDGAGITGCVVANEFYDALPVRVVTRRGGALLERRVGLASGGGAERAAPPSGSPGGTAAGAETGRSEGGPDRFVWVEVPALDSELTRYVQRYGAAPVDCAIAEVALAARGWALRFARALRRGFQITIDYGERAEGLYDVRTRPMGTLLAYRRHRASDDVLARPGEQDITAHVNFSALEDAGRESGIETAGFTTQDRFLIALGLAERIAELGASSDPAAIRARRAMMSLIHPEGMGRIFRVLVQAKGVASGSLRGLRDPFASPLTPHP